MKVSVCMVAYNHEPFIRQAVESVLAQRVTFPLQVVVGEDCSTDGTREVLARMHREDPRRIKLLLRRQNVGMVQNAVETLAACEGEYVALLDGDDYWSDPQKLQRQVAILDHDDQAAASFHETDMIGPSGKVERVYGRDVPDTLDVADTFAPLAPFHSSSFLFRRACFAPPPWLERVISVDMAIFSVVAGHGTLRRVPGNMSVYRKTDRGITSDPETLRTYHQKRIELMRLLDEHHHGICHWKAQQVIEYHESCIAAERGLFRWAVRNLRGYSRGLLSWMLRRRRSPG